MAAIFIPGFTEVDYNEHSAAMDILQVYEFQLLYIQEA